LVIGTLPEGYRPNAVLVFVVQTGEPNEVGRVDVGLDGTVTLNSGAVGETDYTSLSGIEFSTD
jgi:hypothetical protein